MFSVEIKVKVTEIKAKIWKCSFMAIVEHVDGCPLFTLGIKVRYVWLNNVKKALYISGQLLLFEVKGP